MVGCKVKSNWIKEIFKGLTGGDGEAVIVCIRNIKVGLGFDQQSRSKIKQVSNNVLSIYISAL